MLCVDGKTRKQWCLGCGGPRDPELAKHTPCFCCGALGTQKTHPQFDEETGELIIPEPVVGTKKVVTEPAPPKVKARAKRFVEPAPVDAPVVRRSSKDQVKAAVRNLFLEV